MDEARAPASHRVRKLFTLVNYKCFTRSCHLSFGLPRFRFQSTVICNISNGFEDEHRKDKGVGCRQHAKCADITVEGYVCLGNTTALRKITRANIYNGESWQAGRHKPNIGIPSLKQPCHLPEETGVQLLCAASYDIWCRDLDTDQSNTEQTYGRTDENGKKYAQHHMCKDRKTNIWDRDRTNCHRYNQQC